MREGRKTEVPNTYGVSVYFLQFSILPLSYKEICVFGKTTSHRRV